MFEKNVISIDIGAQNIHAVVGKLKRKEYLITDAFFIPTPEDSFDDGRLTNIEALAEQIRLTLNMKNIKVKNLVFTLNSSGTITREIVLPAKKSDQLESMINFEISQFLPVDLSQYIIEYKFMEEFMEDGIKKSKVLVAAVQKSIVDGYYELANKLNLNPSSMDINSNAISKLLYYPTVVNEQPFDSMDTISTIDIGHKSLTVSVINAGRIGISRMITQGSYEIDKTIANILQVDYSEAEEIKKKFLDLNPKAVLKETIVPARESIEICIGDWIRDIERILKFYLSRNAGSEIKHIYLYGGGASSQGICEYLHTHTNIPTSKVSMANNIKLDAKLQGINISEYLNAIGAISNNR